MAVGKKYGGREAGTPNKSTRMVREAIARMAEDNVEEFVGWMREIEDPAKRCDIYLKAIEYHIPKLARTELASPDGGPIAVSVVKYGADSST